MSRRASRQGRLSTLAAALVIARRDFGAILLSRSFIFFLLGPVFMLGVAGLAGGIGKHAQSAAVEPQIGVAMDAYEGDALLAARERMIGRLGSVPSFTIVDRLKPGESVDPAAEMAHWPNVAALLSGSLSAPVLTGPPERIGRWQGAVSLIVADALGQGPKRYPQVALAPTASSTVDEHEGRVTTAQAGQTLLFFLTMLLAGMVLSNLVEEKGNKIIEILAAAIPMDAVFFGKLFAMLAVSFVGIVVWAVAGTAVFVLGGSTLHPLTVPAVGWPMFFTLGVIYFAMAYLLLGSLFLAIGSMATTVREVQTLSMPVTMLQLLVFFFATYAMADPGSPAELAARIVPFSSPFAMLARAAQDGALWPHVVAIAWQALCVAVFVKAGARLFRSRVMKSGAAGGRPQRRSWVGRRSASA